MLGPTGRLLEHYLDLLSLRQRLTASNIANADTPGYRARELDFRFEMQSLINQPPGMEHAPAPAVGETWGSTKNDGNNVNLEREMLALADNTVRFTLASLLLQRKVRGLRNLIQESR